MKNNIFSGAYIRKLFDNKKVAVTFSIVLSIIIWFVAMVNRNPERNQTFNNMKVSISLEGTVVQEMGLGIVSDFASQNFSITVNGPNYIVSSLRPEDLILTASVTNVNAAGKYTLDVVGSSNSKKTGYNIVSIEPSIIEVSFDYIDTKEFTIIPQLIGVSAVEGLVAETPLVSKTEESTITIQGPRTIIDNIGYVFASATVDKTLSVTQTFDTNLTIYDKDGNVIYIYATDGKIYDKDGDEIANNFLTLSKTAVKVTQPISKRTTLQVKAAFSNLPEGMSISDLPFNIDHTTVSVIGTPDVVAKMTEVVLSTIDFKTVSNTSNSFEVSPVLPDGVKLAENIDVFIVTVDTSGYAVRTFNVSEVKFTDVKTGLTAKSDGAIRNVKICGPKKVINSLKESDLYAVASLGNKSSGGYTVSVTIKSDKYNTIWQVGEYSATVTIK